MANPITKDTPDFEAVVDMLLRHVEVINDDGDTCNADLTAQILTLHNQAIEAAIREAKMVQVEADLTFLEQMRKELTSNFGDGIGTANALAMVNDWIDELSQLQTPTNQKGGE